MARMHSRRRGKSGSKKLSVKTKPVWIRYKSREIELLIIKLAKEGNSASKIGLILRDNYSIPDTKMVIGKKITEFLKEKKLSTELPEDLLNLIKKSVMLKKHLEENRQDMTAKRGLQLTDSKIRRLVKYYKKTGAIPVDWKLENTNLKLIVG